MLLVAVLFGVLAGVQAFFSALLGGVLVMIPARLFARRVFKHQGALAARAIARGFYVGEAYKLLLSAFLFTLVFILFKVTPLIFFISYLVAAITHGFAPLIVNNRYLGLNKSD